jgi:hypothetical protein
MSLYRFFGEQGGEHNGRLFWSEALGGLPYRGPMAPNLTRDELETLVEVHHDYHVEEFDLKDQEQKAAYIKVMTRVVNGWYVLHKNLEPTPTTRVLEWSQRYGELSPAVRAALASGGQNHALPG